MLAVLYAFLLFLNAFLLVFLSESVLFVLSAAPRWCAHSHAAWLLCQWQAESQKKWGYQWEIWWAMAYALMKLPARYDAWEGSALYGVLDRT